jgi:hypothetical protein
MGGVLREQDAVNGKANGERWRVVRLWIVLVRGPEQTASRSRALPVAPARRGATTIVNAEPLENHLVSAMFEMLGILLACYTVFALWRGAVFARQGPWGRLFERADEPFHYWSAIVIYAGLSLALVFYF